MSEYLEDITEAMDNGKDVDVIYLDFCKAFDKIPHRRLTGKIRNKRETAQLIKGFPIR